MQLAHAVVHHMVGPIEARGNLLDLRIGTGRLSRPDCFCQQALVFLCPEKTTFPALCIACWCGLLPGLMGCCCNGRFLHVCGFWPACRGVLSLVVLCQSGRLIGL